MSQRGQGVRQIVFWVFPLFGASLSSRLQVVATTSQSWRSHSVPDKTLRLRHYSCNSASTMRKPLHSETPAGIDLLKLQDPRLAHRERIGRNHKARTHQHSCRLRNSKSPMRGPVSLCNDLRTTSTELIAASSKAATDLPFNVYVIVVLILPLHPRWQRPYATNASEIRWSVGSILRKGDRTRVKAVATSCGDTKQSKYTATLKSTHDWVYVTTRPLLIAMHSPQGVILIWRIRSKLCLRNNIASRWINFDLSRNGDGLSNMWCSQAISKG
jgi:hypothetical protein